jgi:hypothetical protein
MEKKVLAVSRDKDSLKTLLHEAEVEIARRWAVFSSMCECVLTDVLLDSAG